MSDWIWLIAYRDGNARVVLAERDTIGTICDGLGSTLLDLSARSWPWWVGLWPGGNLNLGTALHRTAQALLALADRHTTMLAEIPVDDELADTLEITTERDLFDREGE